MTQVTSATCREAGARRTSKWWLLHYLVISVPAAFAVSGCAAGLALSALDMAAQSAQGTPTSNADLKPRALDDCTKQAARYGTPHIIDVQQASISKIIVWGTVDDGQKRLSFECSYGTQIKDFKLRPIKSSVAPAGS